MKCSYYTRITVNVHNWLKRGFEEILNTLFPKKCVGCGTPDTFLCPTCESKLEYVTDNFCLACAKRSLSGFTHPNCTTKYTPERGISVFKYTGVTRKAILRSKFSKSYTALFPFIDIFLEDLVESNLSFGTDSLVVPIPLHFIRRFGRGYNQSEYLAKALAANFKIAYKPELLLRVRNTKRQARLDRRSRYKNMDSAFFVPKKFHVNIKGKDIVLVDDIVTSGATMLSASKALKQAGVRYIYCVSLSKD